MDWEELDSLFGKLAANGLKGAEAIYVDNTEQQTARFVDLCGKHRIIATGGSDFHGRYKPDIDIGTGRGNLRIPYEIVEQLKRV
jgi:hypothetical protein